nr:uncharacterized protein LOC113804177 [Penaeus vannamei]
MAAEVSRNGKIGAGVVLFLVLAVVATLAVGSAFGWYEEKRNLDIPHQNGYKERLDGANLKPTPIEPFELPEHSRHSYDEREGQYVDLARLHKVLPVQGRLFEHYHQYSGWFYEEKRMYSLTTSYLSATVSALGTLFIEGTVSASVIPYSR